MKLLQDGDFNSGQRSSHRSGPRSEHFSKGMWSILGREVLKNLSAIGRTTPMKGDARGHIIATLRQIVSSEKVAEVCRKITISETAFYTCKAQYPGRVDQ